jgi:hypothetical protein
MFMNRFFLRNLIIFPLIVSLVGLSWAPIARAELIGTQTLIELENRQKRIDRIHAVLARSEVRDRLIELGVDPREAQQRVSALSNAELALLEKRIDNLPAGGVLALIGVVFVILIILELVGVTNIFSRM